MWYLVPLRGPDASRKFCFLESSVVWGRAGTPDRDLQLPSDARLSRRQAVLTATEAGIRVEPIEGASGQSSAHYAECVVVPWGGEFSAGASRYRIVRPRQGDWDLPRSAPRPLPRRELEEFVLEEECGSGPCARVYRALDTVTGKRLAIKRLLPEMFTIESAVALFVREMEIHARLLHPNIVRIVCVGRSRAELFIGLEWVEGCNLAEYIAMNGSLTPTEAGTIGIGILDALAHAHAKGLIHRDVKPSNTMVPLVGPLDPKLVDFGMARYSTPSDSSDTLTHTGEVRGTLSFSPPECLLDAKRATETADIFGVGTTLYFALSGMPWFNHDAVGSGSIPAILEADLVPLRERCPTVSPALARVVERAIRAAPADRWQSAEEMRLSLQIAQRGLAPGT